MNSLLQLKTDNCKNCYKCIRECAVKSIKFSDRHAHIVDRECVYCGHCFVVCPQNAKEIRSDLPAARALIASGRPVMVSLAPSFIAAFSVPGLAPMEQALRALGFAGVEETARGAYLVKTAYEELLNRGEHSVLISSCCHSVNLLVQKHFPKALRYLAPVDSPMAAHAKLIRERMPDAAVVFIGPCISKKDEAQHYGAVDCVLTFDELRQWLEEEGISLQESEGTDGSRARSRFFPTPGGIIKSMHTENSPYTYIAVDGLRRCMEVLQEVENGTLENCFIEMNACEGSCIGGPVMHKYRSAPLQHRQRVNRYAGGMETDFDEVLEAPMEKTIRYLGTGSVMPGETAIREVLHKLGKTRPEDELNCGSCGYNTCREKAIAVCQGKADLTMCLPYLKGRAESFSDAILANTPNAIVVMDTRLCIQQMNSAAGRLFGIEDIPSMIGMPMDMLVGSGEYLQAMDGSSENGVQRHYLADYDKYVEESVLFDPDYNVVISIIKDITEETKRAQAAAEERRRTVEIADRVIQKQMRVAQEIASLLGETTAETKIALTKLKETMD